MNGIADYSTGHQYVEKKQPWVTREEGDSVDQTTNYAPRTTFSYHTYSLRMVHVSYIDILYIRMVFLHI